MTLSMLALAFLAGLRARMKETQSTLPPTKRTKGVYPPLLDGMRHSRRHQRAGIAAVHPPLAFKTTAGSQFPLELVDMATPSPSRG